MATQSLYRRYRPRRFSEVRGQDHVVRALRNAVRYHREGHAYLFSGPRGTGKTTSARILAKALNCEAPEDGEPCCRCASCLAIEAGTSYDVFELDAASNNGVEHIRDLIDRASLGTPGRCKVYILDEVHMLSKAASAALLKTLEEPPPHVVFVLATTDPQKVLETIRSRTQHLQFHLLPVDELEAYVRWVAADAGIPLTEEVLQTVLRQGAGSARDTLSALELAATSGGVLDEVTPVDEFVEALIEADTARVLAAAARAIQQGRDPRTLTEDLIGHLRDCFLSLMAPELVQLTDARAEQVRDQARRLGAASLVKAMETLGDVLLEVRHAPDPRVLVEVALVKLTHRELATGLEAVLHRVEQLERTVAQAAAPAAPLAQRDPATGRARLGSRAGSDPTGPVAGPSALERAPTPSAPDSSGSSPPAAQPAAPLAGSKAADPTVVAGRWSTDVLPALKPIVRALYAAGRVTPRSEEVVVAFPNEPHRARAEQHRVAVEQAMAVVGGGPVRLVLTVEREPPSHAAPSPADVEGARLPQLVDAPSRPVASPIDQLTRAFPGSELVSGEG